MCQYCRPGSFLWASKGWCLQGQCPVDTLGYVCGCVDSGYEIGSVHDDACDWIALRELRKVLDDDDDDDDDDEEGGSGCVDVRKGKLTPGQLAAALGPSSAGASRNPRRQDDDSSDDVQFVAERKGTASKKTVNLR